VTSEDGPFNERGWGVLKRIGPKAG
jgi:hypothetical protein